MLADTVKQDTGAKVRGIELSLLQRCGSHLASKTDVDEAWLAGSAAVEAAVSGTTDKMVAFHVHPGQRRVCTARSPWSPWTSWPTSRRRSPVSGSTRRATAWSSPSSTMFCPSSRARPRPCKESALPRFAHLKKVLTTSMK